LVMHWYPAALGIAFAVGGSRGIISRRFCCWMVPRRTRAVLPGRHSSASTATSQTLWHRSPFTVLTSLQKFYDGDGKEDAVASPTTTTEASEEDLQRWQQMYEQGEQAARQTTIKMNDDHDDSLLGTAESNSNPQLQEQQQPIRVISFDLDNTVWKTSATIAAANDALAQYLKQEHNIQPAQRVENIMGDLFRQNKSQYCPVDNVNATKGPVLLTRLRKDAIQHLLKSEFGYENSQALGVADDAFDAWVEARHVAIESHLADNVVETLTALSQLRTVNNHGSDSTATTKTLIVGAITDGNSNPNTVECLSGFFDFVVNAENVGVAKPDRRIYLEAARQVLSRAELADLLPNHQTTVEATSSGENVQLTTATLSDDALEEVIGPWWVHVGDDFVKDIVAAKALSMRTIWVKELIQGKVQKVDATVQTNGSNARTVQDFVKDISSEAEQEGIVKMQVGAEDYLAQSLEAEFADAAISRFAELELVLERWQQELSQNDDNVATTAVAEESSILDLSTPPRPAEEEQPKTSAQELKYCISCGARILAKARFCSECGEAQE